MRRRKLPIEQLQAWAILNGVRFNGTTVRADDDSNDDSKGAGLFAVADIENDHDQDGTVLHVPHDLVLSKELVGDYARSDLHLREVLEAVGEFGRVGAIEGLANLFVSMLTRPEHKRLDIDLLAHANCHFKS